MCDLDGLHETTRVTVRCARVCGVAEPYALDMDTHQHADLWRCLSDVLASLHGNARVHEHASVMRVCVPSLDARLQCASHAASREPVDATLSVWTRATRDATTHDVVQCEFHVESLCRATAHSMHQYSFS